MAARRLPGGFNEPIDLTIDGANNNPLRRSVDVYRNPSINYGAEADDFMDVDPSDMDDFAYLEPFVNDDDLALQLHNIPDIDVPPPRLPPIIPVEDQETLTEALCLQMVLDVLPDISVDYVLELINQQAVRRSNTSEDMQRLITRLLDDGPYPKEQDAINNRKRKRSTGGESNDEEVVKGDASTDYTYQQNALNLLRDEFLDLPVRHIEKTLQEKKSLYDTFTTLEAQVQNYDRISSSFRKIARARSQRGAEYILAVNKDPIITELKAARKQAKKGKEEQRQKALAKRKEEENFSIAQATGQMNECSCCFDDVPRNRSTCCSGDTVHFFCWDCTKAYIETEIGKGKCRPICFADTNCGGTFRRQHLIDSLSKTTFDRLEHMQQQEELAAAGLDFLEDCPFCDFRQECLPVDVDREFRCQAPKCGKVSCRLCRKNTHIPMTCEEAKKDDKLNARHQVEEAKSEALIRKCNRCKNPFIKESGCNKMTCTKCGNQQCYVCSKDITDYKHFADHGGRVTANQGKCPLHDNQEDRHEQEVQKAEAEALAKVRAERPDISEEELKIEVSDRVKETEDARRSQAQQWHQGFGFVMQGDQLQAIPGAQAAPAIRNGPDRAQGFFQPNAVLRPPFPAAGPAFPARPGGDLGMLFRDPNPNPDAMAGHQVPYHGMLQYRDHLDLQRLQQERRHAMMMPDHPLPFVQPPNPFPAPPRLNEGPDPNPPNPAGRNFIPEHVLRDIPQPLQDLHRAMMMRRRPRAEGQFDRANRR